MPTRSFQVSLPYFIAIAIDAIGFTIIGPVLVPLTNHLVANNELTQHLLYGLILSIFSLSFMFGAPILGALSDLLGRRKVLIIASLGVLFGYLCYAISLNMMSLSFLILGRITTGFCAASQCIAQAAMVDLSQNKNRVNNIGLIASAMTTGLVIGPLASLSLSDKNLSLSAFKTPFYSITGILILNLIYLIFFLKESYQLHSFTKEVNIIKIQTQEFLEQFSSYKNTRNVFIVFFLFELGWSLYYQSLAIELPINLKLEPKTLALLLSFLGANLAAGLLILVRIVFRRFHLSTVYSSALCLGTLILILQFFFKNLIAYYCFGFIITSLVALIYSGLIAQLSQQTESKSQGLLMGTSDAVLALAFTITGLLAGALAYYLPGLSLLTAGGFWLLAFLIANRERN